MSSCSWFQCFPGLTSSLVAYQMPYQLIARGRSNPSTTRNCWRRT